MSCFLLPILPKPCANHEMIADRLDSAVKTMSHVMAINKEGLQIIKDKKGAIHTNVADTAVVIRAYGPLTKMPATTMNTNERNTKSLL